MKTWVDERRRVGKESQEYKCTPNLSNAVNILTHISRFKYKMVIPKPDKISFNSILADIELILKIKSKRREINLPFK